MVQIAIVPTICVRHSLLVSVRELMGAA
jgi:hypothetical protein